MFYEQQRYPGCPNLEEDGVFVCPYEGLDFDELIREEVAVLWNGPLLDDFVKGVVLHAGDEKDTGSRPGAKERVVVVGPVEGDDGARGKVELE